MLMQVEDVFLAIFCFLNRFDKDVKLHPWLLYKGSDARKNMEMTVGKYSEQIRNLEGKEVSINGETVKIKMYGLFDLCALNCLVGKRNHSSTYPCAMHKDMLKNDYNVHGHRCPKNTCRIIQAKNTSQASART